MANDREQKPADLVRQRAKEERRLLRAEQAAERTLLKATERLSVAEGRLEKQQALVDRRRGRVTTALEDLRRRQDARAIGPNGTDPASTAAPTTIEAKHPSTPDRDDSPVTPQLESVADTAPAEPTDGTQPARRTTKRRTDKADTPA